MAGSQDATVTTRPSATGLMNSFAKMNERMDKLSAEIGLDPARGTNGQTISVKAAAASAEDAERQLLELCGESDDEVQRVRALVEAVRVHAAQPVEGELRKLQGMYERETLQRIRLQEETGFMQTALQDADKKARTAEEYLRIAQQQAERDVVMWKERAGRAEQQVAMLMQEQAAVSHMASASASEADVEHRRVLEASLASLSQQLEKERVEKHQLNLRLEEEVFNAKAAIKSKEEQRKDTENKYNAVVLRLNGLESSMKLNRTHAQVEEMHMENLRLKDEIESLQKVMSSTTRCQDCNSLVKIDDIATHTKVCKRTAQRGSILATSSVEARPRLSSSESSDADPDEGLGNTLDMIEDYIRSITQNRGLFKRRVTEAETTRLGVANKMKEVVKSAKVFKGRSSIALATLDRTIHDLDTLRPQVEATADAMLASLANMTAEVLTVKRSSLVSGRNSVSISPRSSLTPTSPKAPPSPKGAHATAGERGSFTARASTSAPGNRHSGAAVQPRPSSGKAVPVTDKGKNDKGKNKPKK